MKLLTIVSMVFIGAANLAACTTTTTPRTDDQMGVSLKTIKAEQALNSNASNNRDPVGGLDSQSAKSAMDNYHESFRKPKADTGSSFSPGSGTK